MATKKENLFPLDKNVYERINKGLLEFLLGVSQDVEPQAMQELQRETLAALVGIDQYIDPKAAVGRVLGKLNGQAGKLDGKALGKAVESFRLYEKLDEEDRLRVTEELPLSLSVDLLMARNR